MQPATLMQVCFVVISSPFPKRTQANVAGRCRRQSTRPIVASSRILQHGSSFPSQSATSTLKLLQCKPFAHLT